MLGLAKRVQARILQASTSEVYGDPEVHPQVQERKREKAKEREKEKKRENEEMIWLNTQLTFTTTTLLCRPKIIGEELTLLVSVLVMMRFSLPTFFLGSIFSHFPLSFLFKTQKNKQIQL